MKGLSATGTEAFRLDITSLDIGLRKKPRIILRHSAYRSVSRTVVLILNRFAVILYPGQMPLLIIDPFEMVIIQDKCRERIPLSYTPGDFLSNSSMIIFGWPGSSVHPCGLFPQSGHGLPSISEIGLPVWPLNQ